VLHGCGGGDGDGNGNGAPGPNVISAGTGCELTYILTNPALLTGLDPLLTQQWHLRNTGQNGGLAGEDLRAPGAWSVTRGEGVRVAVVDDAVELPHPDLRPNVVEGASRSYRAGNRGSQWPVPCSASVDDHGTAVAGIVLARDGNALGGAGVAPRASLVAYDALSSSLDGDIADALTRDGQLNAIFHNSWGSPDDGRLHPTEASFVAAIESGIANGRGGRGSVYVFPGGNGGCFVRSSADGSCQVDNANFDGYVNKRGVLTICAVDDVGRQPWYGEPGANLLVCAPSSGDRPVGVTTTGLRGGYRNDFTGTSASAPMASGVVALMLAANPALTWRDVRLILARTARRNDPTEPGWASNADGLAFNHKYGFGVIDARAAVAAAAGWQSVGGTSSLTTCTITERAPGLPIPDAPASGPPTPVVDTVTVAGCAITRIEFVELTMTATHTYSGDLRIRLTSPSGLVSELAHERICGGTGSNPCGEYADWTFGSVRHLDEAADGDWTLTVTDMAPLDDGRLERWSLRIHGR
jgi:proprotein convertase subtilisin/kexin type 2